MTALMKLSEHPQAFRARSLSIPFWVEFARDSGELVTLEGQVRYQGGDAIVTGVQGEQWPVPRERFLATYEPIPPTQIGKDGHYSKNAREVWALELKVPIEVTLSSHRGLLKGKAGDVLIEYATGDQSVVAGNIFMQTYQKIGG